MKWITRERPKIDRLACPWLIRRFIDKEAEIIYVPFDQVVTQATALGATPFDIPGVEFTVFMETNVPSTILLRNTKIKDKAVPISLAPIVRGAI